MCGICGFENAITYNNDKKREVINAMCDSIAHRGPDGQGSVCIGNSVLGHRRLSLVDLSNGWQPMSHGREIDSHVKVLGQPMKDTDGTNIPFMMALENDSTRFAIVYNGEIYNYKEIRAELESLGWEFSTSSDTEVLLIGYMAWGESVLKKLRGMYAFAIWDGDRKDLLLARDPFGIKPLYYAENVDGTFVFASEAKAILEYPRYEPSVDRDALAYYLMYEFNPIRKTLFAGIEKLPPATFIRVSNGHITKEERFWEATLADKTKTDISKSSSINNWAKRIDNAFRKSIKYHNVADVEVGSFLSSGIDSSYMASCLAGINPNVETFTVGFEEFSGERDEISWASELASKRGFKNKSRHITQDEYWNALPSIQYHMDEPLGDPAAVALWFVDELASKYVKAVLSGEGADELFAGYSIYKTPLEAHKISWLPSPLLRAGASILERVGIKGSNYLKRASGRPEDWYYTNANGSTFTRSECSRLLRDSGVIIHDPLDAVKGKYVEARSLGYDDIESMQYVDLKCWMADDILLKTDKMSMAHSLESRVPFLDMGVYEIASEIPIEKRINTIQTKIPLRAASLSALPDEYADKEKLGFPVPLATWLREPKYADILREAFTCNTAKEFFDTEMLNELLNRHLAGEDLSRRIWIVYMFLIWHERFFQ